MFKSMTAFGRAVHASSLGRFVAELHSVNRKHLEINTFIPYELLRFDAEIKRWIAAEVGRGQVNVKISASFEKFSPVKITPNLPLIKQYRDAWRSVTEALRIQPNDALFLQMLSDKKEIFLSEEEALEEGEIKSVLQELVLHALTQLKEMKQREGALLFQDIAARFARLPSLIQEIAVKAPGATQRYRQRLMDRIAEIMGGQMVEEERVLKEVSIFAEKIDIAEELTRFESHLQQAREMMHSIGAGVGKTLEFLLQELNREINTIISKSSDLDVSRTVIEIKSELERIREQIQNIE